MTCLPPPRPSRRRQNRSPMSLIVTVPAIVTAGVDFTLQVAAIPSGDFTVTIAVGPVNQQFGLKRGTLVTKPKAASQNIHVDGAANWDVTDLDIANGAGDFTATLTE